mmetsp:Transcript_18330/g.32772  ORF Transcript_18330/g.32772 Transcript_18330/m.32772 type:complete len:243 (+) Transcript_18330:197-925(+)
MANPRSVAQLVVVLATTAISAVHGFTPPPSISISTIPNDAIQRSQYSRPPATITALNQEKEKKGSTGINRTVSNKLLVETVAPFRGLRLFLYAAFASGAFVGGLITLSGVAAAMNGLRDDVDMNTEYLNLAIDFGAVAFFGVCAKFDLDKDAELTAAVEAKVERKKANKKITASMREREQLMKKLNVDVKVSQDGGTRVAPLGVMQENAKQHVILVAGPGRAIRDALRGAQLNKVNFAMTNT